MEKNTTHTKSEITRQFIIQKVAPIFNSKGFAATALSDMTKATGLTKGAIYGNFTNKNEIAVEAFKYNVAHLTEALDNEIMLASSALSRLYAITAVLQKLYPLLLEIGGSPFQNTIVDSYQNHEELFKLTGQYLKNLKNSIRIIIKNGIKNKEIKKSTDVDKFAGLVISITEGGFLLSKALDDNKYFINSLKHINKMIDKIKK